MRLRRLYVSRAHPDGAELIAHRNTESQRVGLAACMREPKSAVAFVEMLPAVHEWELMFPQEAFAKR